MYVYSRRLIYFFLILFYCFCCSVLKVIENNGKNYSGDIKFMDNESINLKFTLKIDESKTVKMKLFENFGIKVAEIVIKKDSIIIESIFLNEYKKYIEEFFFKYNNALCINYLISDIFDFKVFNIRDIPVCYVKERDEGVSKDVIKIYTIEQNYVMSIIKNEIISKHKKSVNLNFNSNKYCVLNFIDLKNQ